MAKKILITGASSGIGEACAKILAAEGNSILATGRRVDRLKNLKSDQVQITELDMQKSDSIDAFIKKNREWLDGVDVIVNNAGLALGRDKFQDSPVEDIKTVIETNVIGLLELSRKLLPFMIPHKKGQIINLGSVAGEMAYQGGTVYCASKAAVHMITDALRLDLGGSGIRVCTIAPGRVETEFSVVRFKGDKQTADKAYQGYRKLVAKDIAECIAWVINRPEYLNIQQITLMSTDQPNAVTINAL